jgi:SCY1-like protein 1
MLMAAFLYISYLCFQSEKVLYMATEYVEPLETHLTQLSKEGHQQELYLAWGIFQITVSSQNCVRGNDDC